MFLNDTMCVGVTPKLASGDPSQVFPQARSQPASIAWRAKQDLGGGFQQRCSHQALSQKITSKSLHSGGKVPNR